MKLVDAQAHIWAASRPDRPWPAGRAGQEHRVRPVSVRETLEVLNQAGVHGAVLVPPSWEGDRNDLVWAAAWLHPDRFAAMGRVRIDDLPDRARLSRWLARRGNLGVRITLHTEPWHSRFADGGLDSFWAAAEDSAVPVMVYAPGLLREFAALCERHPGLRLVFDHLGLPLGTKGPAAFAGLPQLLDLARFPQVAVKASALPCHSAHAFPFRDVHDSLRRVLDAFGPQRVFWGSDWTRLPCSYEENIRLFTEELPFLSGTDLEWVMGAGVMRWLSWTPEA